MGFTINNYGLMELVLVSENGVYHQFMAIYLTREIMGKIMITNKPSNLGEHYFHTNQVHLLLTWHPPIKQPRRKLIRD
jgi:hypothetical protein